MMMMMMMMVGMSEFCDYVRTEFCAELAFRINRAKEIVKCCRFCSAIVVLVLRYHCQCKVFRCKSNKIKQHQKVKKNNIAHST